MSDQKFKGNPNFVPSRNTVLLHEHLLTVPIGGEVSYAALSRIVGEKVNGSYPALISARRRAQTIDAAVFDAVRGEGLKRLAPPDVVAKTTARRKGIGNAATRGLKELATVFNGNSNSLSKDDQYVAHANKIVYKEVQRITKQATVEGATFSAELADSNNLNIERVLKQFLRSGKRVTIKETVETETTIDPDAPSEQPEAR